MKFIFFLLIAMNACVASKQSIQTVKKLEVIKIDSTNDHFVFNTKTDAGDYIIVLAEKERVEGCKPFKKFIIADSIYETSIIKAGSKKEMAGFYLGKINGIAIRRPGELIKLIWNCNCFTDK